MKDFYKVYEVKVVYSEGLATLTGPEPPPGIEGVDPHANGAPLGERGIGAFAIGNVKYRTESALFKQMTESKTPLRLNFRQAFDLARALA